MPDEMTKSIKGIFSWEDVLAQRYLRTSPPSTIQFILVLTNPDNHPKYQPNHIQSREQNHGSLNQTNYYPFQPHSPLLAKLSPELRLLIWEYVLGGRCIHIVQWASRRMGYALCPNSDGDGNKGKTCDVCQTGLLSRRACAKRGGKTETRGLLSLLLVCRQMYAPISHAPIWTYTNITAALQIHRSRTHSLHKQHLHNPIYLVPSLPPLTSLTLLTLLTLTHPHKHSSIPMDSTAPVLNPPLRLSRPLASQQRPR